MASSHDLVLTTVPGGNALSPFRAAALLERLHRAVPTVTGVSARHVHWVASEQPLDEATAASPTMTASTTMSRTRSAVVSTETKPCRGMRMPPSWPSGEIGWTRRRACGGSVCAAR